METPITGPMTPQEEILRKLAEVLREAIGLGISAQALLDYFGEVITTEASTGEEVPVGPPGRPN